MAGLQTGAAIRSAFIDDSRVEILDFPVSSNEMRVGGAVRIMADLAITAPAFIIGPGSINHMKPVKIFPDDAPVLNGVIPKACIIRANILIQHLLFMTAETEIVGIFGSVVP